LKALSNQLSAISQNADPPTALAFRRVVRAIVSQIKDSPRRTRRGEVKSASIRVHQRFQFPN
jgi:hypothetical protein